MESDLNSLMQEVVDHGASLRVQGRHLDLKGALQENLKSKLRENKEALTEYLTYDQETVDGLLRAARAYISERYTTGSELELDSEALDERIAQAEIDEDMWALRTAVREWVLAWVRAIDKARQRRRYLKAALEEWFVADEGARVWALTLPRRGDEYVAAQLWQVVGELEDRGVSVANEEREVVAMVLMEVVGEIVAKPEKVT